MLKLDKNIIICFVLFFISISFYIYRNIVGIGFLPFGDETGHFLGAITIQHHDILYRDYIDEHGPLIFLVTWLLGQIVGFSKIWLLRLVSTFFIVMSGISIFYSPIFNNLHQRLLATALWFFAMSSVWTVQGLYLDSYWTVGGALTVIGLATVIFPMLCKSPILTIHAFIGGAAIGLLPATAYSFSFVPLTFFIVVAYISICKHHEYRKIFLFSLLGCCFANLLVMMWLLIYGDLKGLIVYHFVLNQFYYINYVSVGLKTLIDSFIPSFCNDHLISNLVVYTFILGSIILFCISAYKMSALIIILGVLTLQLRGSVGFQNGAFLIASFGLFILSFVRKTENKPILSIFSSVLIMLIMVVHGKYATSSPFGETMDKRKNITWKLFGERLDLGFTSEIQKYTKADERILVIPYNPDVYIYANRLPIKKYHAYLPWEADYAQHSWNGYERDICKDLPLKKPPVIYFDNYIVWGQFPAEKYMPCVLDFMKVEYTRLPNNSYVYVRNDLIHKN
ncbi:unnamed protein product [Commensalibacter communis]|uniref:hypothetical protein n=1 Tax=Commensalibacter communis TaxID=2972786 RepID=UPI0022FFB2F3|nr:hypothetical protein [Commensalibacter communis]CAI3938706.1 unnamed protein product [Commensalibacter communis]